MLQHLLVVSREYAASVKKHDAQVAVYTARSLSDSKSKLATHATVARAQDFFNVQRVELENPVRGYCSVQSSITSSRHRERAYDESRTLGGFASVMDEFFSFFGRKVGDILGAAAPVADLLAIRVRKGMVSGIGLNRVDFCGQPYLCYDFDKDSIPNTDCDQWVDLQVRDISNDCDILSLDLFEIANDMYYSVCDGSLPEYPFAEWEICEKRVMKYLDQQGLLCQDGGSWDLHFNVDKAEDAYKTVCTLVKDADFISRCIWQAAFASHFVNMWNHDVEFCTTTRTFDSAAHFWVQRVRDFTI